jgi:16S rRNA (guanine966-N2)-methyltransferase
VRVIAGEKSGRRLLAPSGRETRPTADRVREAAFSMVESQVPLDGASVWDLFAGSGALGIEALSRGAAHVTFVDQARTAISVNKVNLARLGYGPERARVVCADVLRWVHGVDSAPASADEEDRSGPARPLAHVDLVLADPPYAWQAWPALLGGLVGLDPLLVIETSEEPELPPVWHVVKAKRYGGTLVTLARLRAGDNVTEDTVGGEP